MVRDCTTFTTTPVGAAVRTRPAGLAGVTVIGRSAECEFDAPGAIEVARGQRGLRICKLSDRRPEIRRPSLSEARHATVAGKRVQQWRHCPAAPTRASGSVVRSPGAEHHA